MSTVVRILLGIVYLTALFMPGLATLRQGHTALFWSGSFLWALRIAGAIVRPTRAAIAAHPTLRQCRG